MLNSLALTSYARAAGNAFGRGVGTCLVWLQTPTLLENRTVGLTIGMHQSRYIRFLQRRYGSSLAIQLQLAIPELALPENLLLRTGLDDFCVIGLILLAIPDKYVNRTGRGSSRQRKLFTYKINQLNRIGIGFSLGNPNKPLEKYFNTTVFSYLDLPLLLVKVLGSTDKGVGSYWLPDKWSSETTKYFWQVT